MTDRLTIAAYRTQAEGRTQIALSQTDENGRGHGYRLAGPKHYNLGTTLLVESDLDERDAAEIRRMLDAAFPADQAKHRNRVLTEAAEILRKLPAAEEDRWWDTRDRDLAIRRLLAARTGQEG